MKILLSVLFLTAGVHLGFGQNAGDSFSTDIPKMPDRSEDKKSDSFLDAKMLKNLGERRLDGDASHDVRAVVVDDGGN